MKEKLKNLKIYNILAILAICLLFSVLFVYALITVYSSDDYGYSLFLDNGISGWMKMMQNHYQFGNGRTFVHLLATAVLHFKNIVFALVFSVNLLVIAFCLRSKPVDKLSFWLIFLSGWILIPRPIMVEGVLWISGFCNYVFPIMMMSLVFYMSRKALSENSYNWKNVIILPVLSFLAGATTEQNGLAVLLLLVIIFIEAILDRSNKYAKICFLQILLVAAGLSTIFLSPATQSRVGNEMSAPVWERIIVSLSMQKDIFMSSPVFSIIVAVFPILLLVNIYRKKGSIFITSLSVLAEICLFFVAYTEGEFSAYSYGALLLILSIIAAACWFSGYRYIGSLLCFAAVTAIVMLPTQSSGYRTLLPMYVLLLMIVCELFCDAKEGLVAKKGILAKLLVALAVVFAALNAVRDFPHYYYNHRVDMVNAEYAEQAKSSGNAYFCMDYNYMYTHTKPYQSGYFYLKYIETLRLASPPEHVYFYSKHLPAVYVNDVRMNSPGIPSVEGEWLMPMRDIVESLGGRVLWSRMRGTQILIGDKTYNFLRKDAGYELSWQDDEGWHDMAMPVNMAYNYYSVMLPAEFYRDILGLDVNISDSKIRINSR